MEACPAACEDNAVDVTCRILPEGAPADPARLLHIANYPECGAVVSFCGNVRATEDGRELVALDYEHHPTMARRELEKVLRNALAVYDIRGAACEHSTGCIAVQQVSVAVAVAADHRQAAFDACQYIMDELKRTVPIWKKPVFAKDEAAL